MGDLSTHFSRWEFKCSCNQCGHDSIDYETLAVLEDLRGHFDSAIKITSAHRCRAHNSAVGGAKSSLHLQGRAADVQVAGVSPAEVAEYLRARYPERYGIGEYNTFVHIDTRTNGPARWSG